MEVLDADFDGLVDAIGKVSYTWEKGRHCGGKHTGLPLGSRAHGGGCGRNEALAVLDGVQSNFVSCSSGLRTAVVIFSVIFIVKPVAENIPG